MITVNNLSTFEQITYTNSLGRRKALSMAYMKNTLNRSDWWNCEKKIMNEIKECNTCYYIGDWVVMKDDPDIDCSILKSNEE